MSIKFGRHALAVFGLFASCLLSSSARALVCDVNADGAIDRTDIMLILGARNALASGPGDPRDPDGDGRITVVDARICTLRCSRPNCSTTSSAPVANAGAAQTVHVTDTVTLNGSKSSDPDGDPLTFAWSFVSRPLGSKATLTGADTVAPTFVADSPGSYVVQLIVNDGKLSSAPATVTISTQNSAPTANAGPNQSVHVTDTVHLNGAGSTDVDGDPLTFAWTLTIRPAGSVTTLANANAVNPTFVADKAGTYVAKLIVHDGHVASLPSSVSITTLNSPPVANAGPDQSVLVTDTVSLNGASSTDVDGDALTFIWSLTTRPAGSGAALSDPNVVNPKFVADKAGTYVAQLVVNDGTALSAPDTVTITTRNSAPVANPGSNRTVALGSLVQLNGSGSTDVDGDSLSYRWALTVKPSGSGATLSNASIVNPTFVADRVGSYVAQLIVNDGTVDSLPATVTIATLNSPPVANAGPDQSVPLGGTVSLTGIASSDADGNPLTYRWSLLSRPVNSHATLSSTSVVNPTFVLDKPGTYVAQLIVNDGFVDSAPDTVSVTTENSIPVANAGPDQTVNTGTTVGLNGGASSDADGDALAYFWSFTSRPGGSLATLTGANTATPTFVADRAGIYVAQLIVNDGVVDSAPDTVMITAIMPNTAPVAVNDSYNVDENSTLNVPAPGVLGNDSDAEGSPLTATLNTAPLGVLTLRADGSFTYSPKANAVGIDSFTYRASDGALPSNVATVTITIKQVNRPPVANAGSNQNVTTGATVALDGTASSDPDGDVLVYAWTFTSRPAGSSATLTNASSANSSFVADIAGPYTIQLIVNDGKVNSAPASVTVTATPSNTAPVAVNDAYTTVQGQQLHVAAPGVLANDHDADGQPLSATLVTNAANGTLTLRSDGGFDYLSNAAFTGTDSFTYRASDGTLSSNVATVAITVQPPVIATLTSIVVQPSSQTLLAGATQALSAIGVLSDGTSQNLTVSANWTTSSPAVATVSSSGVVTAVAAGGAVISATSGTIVGTAAITVRAQVTDTTPPVAIITAPATNATLTTVTTVTGTANDANFLRYELSIARAGDVTFTLLNTGTSAVVSGPLGTLDPTILINDLYTLKLAVFDRGGNKTETSVLVQVTRDEKVGNFTVAFEDLNLPLAGLPINITRIYDSRDKSSGDFGVGWTLSLRTLRLSVSRELGSDWVVNSSGGILPTYTFSTPDPHKVSLTLSDGKVEEFDMTLSPASSFIVPFEFVTAGFTPRSGTLGTLEAVGSNSLFVVGSQPGPITLVDDSDFFTVYDPQTFRYTSIDGKVYTVNRTTGVQRIQEPNGNTLTFGPNGIVHSSGKAITYLRDSKGRITQITDPVGSINRYTYDANGDLSSYVDPLGNTTRFFYNLSHGLIEIRDPLGRRGMRQEYDANGRLTAVIDAAGNRREFTHNVGARQDIVKDRLGNISVLNYDASGNIVSETNALGDTVTRTFNAQGKVLTETDPLGHTTSSTYDANGNLLTKADPLGNITRYTYNALNLPLSITDPRGNVTVNTFDSRGNLLTATGPTGKVVTNTYDVSGNRTNTIDEAGTVFRYEYDSSGSRTKYTDALGNMTQYAYDANARKTSETSTRTNAAGNTVTATTGYNYDAKGRLIEVIDALGNRTKTEYDAVGKESATIDKLGQRTTKAYDELGRLIQITYPDGSTESFGYDAEGNRTSSIDALGRTTRYAYDPLKRLVQTTYPDGSSTGRVYDTAGRLIADIDENGHRSSYGYDAAGRRTSLTDALGAVTSYAYDANGNQTSSKDGNGNTTQFQFDANNRKIKTIFADGTSSSVSYDGRGRKLSQIDQAGNATTYQYDASGRLIKVIDAEGRQTAYGYDQVGNKLSQTDANGHVTRWAYDEIDRRVRRTLPLGMAETFTHDANGNVLTHTDFNGAITRYAYAVASRDGNRLMSKTYPSGPPVGYTYTAAGKVATVTDARGTTAYSYDLRDRITGVVDPDTTSVGYTYDARGNRLSVSPPSGATRYGYDAVNRLLQVTDPHGAITTYGYDAVGSRTSVAYPNGTTARYVYDALNRLTRLSNQRSDLSVVSSHIYTLGPSGNRTRVVDGSGRAVDYSYDKVYRLLGENVIDPALGNSITAYVYDPVGNRTSKTVNALPTNYSYDANDRLVSEGSIGYSYDNNGNNVTRVQAAQTTTMSFDPENRLVSEAGPGVANSYAYDVDGIRTIATRNGVVTRYVLDRNRDLARVLMEKDAAGSASVSYVYGDDLISQTRGAFASYYHYDGIGSTRALTDGGALLTDSYTYDAFGNLAGSTGGTVNTYLFAAEQADRDTGRYYLRARYYAPATGRFISIDPLEGHEFDPSSLHKYVYAAGDPINRKDPSGLDFDMAGLSVGLDISATLGSLAISGVQTALLLGRIAVAVGQTAVAACALSAAISFSTSLLSGNWCDVTKYNVFYPDLHTPVTSTHIATAMFPGGRPANLHRIQPTVRGPLYFPGSPCGIAATPGFVCDEYPFASTAEGYASGVPSLMLTPSIESPIQGGLLGAFYRVCSVIPNDPYDGAFGVVPVSAFLAVPWVCK